MLMHIATPTFSLFSMLKFQSNTQGQSASTMSMAPEYPADHWYSVITLSVSMHHPSKPESQILANGRHLTHMNSMAVPNIPFSVTIINQIIRLIHGSDSRMMVSANEVL